MVARVSATNPANRGRETPLRARQMLGKYRIDRRLAEGPYANVYAATDSIEGVRVALKVPHLTQSTTAALEGFRAEVKITGRLDHENILAVKNADFIKDRFVIATPLGVETLSERLKRRIALSRAYDFAEQLLSAIAHAHERRIIHCDIKPDNVILFPDDRLCLADFGISHVALRTLSASGSGTVGYLAPEQALGQPRFQSDVFSAAVVIYEMITRERPEWPFHWPLPGAQRLRRSAPPEFVKFLQRSLQVEYRRRFGDGGKMLAAYQVLRPQIDQLLKRHQRERRSRSPQ